MSQIVKTDIITASLDRMRRAVRDAVRTRYFPEVWVLSESWLTRPRAKSVLVVGYGLGLTSEALAKSGWNVVTADQTPEALAHLRHRFAKQQLKGAFEQAQPECLPFPDQAFDAVISVNSLELCQSPVMVIREMARVLKPGGHSVIATANPHSPWAWPLVSAQCNLFETRTQPRYLSRSQLGAAVAAAPWKLHSIREKAFFLPIPKPWMGLKLPLPGCFIALTHKTINV